MNVLDIILIILLLWAVYQGFKDGIVVQFGGLAGLLIGIYFAFRYGSAVGSWFGISEQWATISGFAIILVLVIVGVSVLSRLLRGVFSFAGLAILDKVGGMLVSALKTGLVLGLLLYCFNWLNDREGWVKQGKLDQSTLYHPLIKVASFSFPYIDFVKDKLFDPEDSSRRRKNDSNRGAA